MSSAPSVFPNWLRWFLWACAAALAFALLFGTASTRIVPDVSDLVAHPVRAELTPTAPGEGPTIPAILPPPGGADDDHPAVAAAGAPAVPLPAPDAAADLDLDALDVEPQPDRVAMLAPPDDARAPTSPPPAATRDADSPVCPADEASWLCLRDPPSTSAPPARRAASLTVGRASQWLAPVLDLFGAPDVSLHPSSALVVRVTDLAGWIDAHDGASCERHVRLYVNDRRLPGIEPTLCDLASGRVLFQLRNLDLRDTDLTPDDAGHGWKALLRTRSHTFWTDASFTVGWDAERPLPSTIGWRAGAVMWLLPPVNAWMALAAISFAGVLVLTLGLYTGMLREGEAGTAWSLSRAQGAWWFLCVFASWEVLCAFQRAIVAMPATSIGLLGIAGGTYSIAVTREGDASKGPSRGFWRDLVSDRDGPVMHRLQMTAWSLALGVAYVYGTIVELDLPDIDETLLVLMGMSSAGYLSMRHTEKQAVPPASTPT